MEEYFNGIQLMIDKAHAIAVKAREKNYDPEPTPSVFLAKDMAERVEGLISTVAPQLKGKGTTKRIKELEEKYGFLDWRVSLVIAEEVANEKFCKFKNKLEAMEIGIRTGFAYHTLGTVASPLEGFVRLEIKKRKDGKEYLAAFYSGPIRSAGGTGSSVSLLITDYIRKKKGYSIYDPTEEEIKRYVTELYDYHERITNLQYLPSNEEIIFLAKHIPIQIDGDPSEKIEVSNYKDIPRIETNRIRNGVCLVMGEGLAQKAPKLWKQLSEWGSDFGLGHWVFLKEFIELQKKIKSKGQTTEEEKENTINPDYTYIKDLVAGRPVLTHPLHPGGFRLRYGRSRTSGYSASSLHPATMIILNDYIATGTQLKLERPGKATTVTPCDSIDGPIVKLNNGQVLQIETEKDAKKHFKNIKEILFLGDILISYGDFFNRAHTLIPPGYCPEWWVQELEKSIVNLFGSLDIEKTSELITITPQNISRLLENPLFVKPSAKAATVISDKLNIPLHPFYTFHWNLISKEKIKNIAKSLEKSNIKKEGKDIVKIIMPFDEKIKRTLELIGLPHLFVNNEFIVIEQEEAVALAFSFGLTQSKDTKKLIELIDNNNNKENIEILNQLPGVILRDKSGVFIGARMGRPEKAKLRKLTGSPNVLFPVGEEGGRHRSFQSALEKGTIRAEFPLYHCEKCNQQRINKLCEKCNQATLKKYSCKICGIIDNEDCKKHGKAATFKIQDLNITDYFNTLLNRLKTKVYPDLIKGVRGTSNKDHLPEPLMKGILRAEQNIYVNKDGTTRYDMTQLPITGFKPIEVGTPIDELKKLGYIKDIKGKQLTDENQLLELLPQDIILPRSKGCAEDGAHKVFFRVAKFIDNLLVKFYRLPPFYNLKKETDLVGHLVAILAPHTSAAIIGRVIGFSKTQGLYASPLIHAATRRDCDGDEACCILLLDVLLNFSRQYLPAHRGSTQDAPLILTSKLIPAEVDDMVFDLDVSWRYPLEFYEAACNFKKPWEVDIPLFKSKVNTPDQYIGFGFTHPIKDINSGVTCSAYKTLPSMQEKLMGQMDLAEKIRAVDEVDVARIVIEKHFIRDIRGNLRRFATQTFRCVDCNEKFRRPPLVGKCTKCHGKIVFTVSEGTIIKYLGPTISLAEKYSLSPYLRQTISLTKRMIESIFGQEKEKQLGLGGWFD
jgi:DNA polymerase II large subunit